MFGFCPLFTPTLLSRRAGSDVDATAAADRTLLSAQGIFFLDFFSCLICIKRRSVCSDILSFFGEVFKGDLFHAILDPHSSLDPFELVNPHSSVLNT